MGNNVKAAVRFSMKTLCVLSFALALFFIVFPVQAADISAVPTSQKLIPLGRTTGIKLFSEGTMVVGFAEVGSKKSQSPAQQAGLECGDIILAVNETEIDSNESLMDALSVLPDGNAAVTFKRDGEEQTCSVSAIYDDEAQTWRLGAWVRDSMAGIGTITYVDPQTGVFGALGHGVCDVDTGELMPFENGSLMSSNVIGVKKGQEGTPGELTGSFDMTCDQGTLYLNTNSGIYGRIDEISVYEGQKALDTVKKSEIKTGKATILANVDGEQTESYEINILRVYPENDDSMRDMMIQVTDERLLEKTGGIVQGMSGSPIIQNDKLVGAVTHVLINDPTRGYGINIERMIAGTQLQ